ncbi:uncharacterized protein BX664DRAFT_249893, partial [Halteromyces radiatus]|uniref:uncharacterized protein n=1 Tax=Halteromyces radiatus TaxID=101107 RepID=UPI00221F2B31
SVSVGQNPDARKSRGGKPKLFQCTGYGDCRMVFTRSEHLARHMRKHTGEKPFKCVVPGCNRMFSRFDNMMQHTQTHNKSRGAPRLQDLCNPIEYLERPSSCDDDNDEYASDQDNKTKMLKQEDGVDLTLDEYEAIQGFGRFQ